MTKELEMKTSLLDCENKHMFVHMKRSGGHAIINWLIQQTRRHSLFVNNVNPVPLPKLDKKSLLWSLRRGSYFYLYKKSKHEKTETTLRWRENLAERTHSFNCDLVFNYEHIPLEKLKNFDKINNIKTYKYLILRDPFNWMSSLFSRDKKFSYSESEGGHRTFAEDSIKNWKMYAREYLKDSEFININYNEWFTSQEYRKNLCEKLNLEFTDRGFLEVPSAGAGSSFDGIKYDKKSSSMKVLERYKQFDISEYVDEELIYYGKRIFDIEWKK